MYQFHFRDSNRLHDIRHNVLVRLMFEKTPFYMANNAFALLLVDGNLQCIDYMSHCRSPYPEMFLMDIAGI